MAKTNAERSREYRQRKNENKVKKIPKTSTERVREFRERQQKLFAKQNNNSTVNLIGSGGARNGLKLSKKVSKRRKAVGTPKEEDVNKYIVECKVEPEEYVSEQLERSPLLLDQEIKQEENFIVDEIEPPSPLNEPWDDQEQDLPLVRNEPLKPGDEELLDCMPYGYANGMECNALNHQRTKYHCIECDRYFNSYNALKYHQRTHTEQRSFKCEICEKSFYTQSVLNVHKKRHTDNRPYKCVHCGHRCRQLVHLQSHILSRHSTVKAFSCEFCGKSFARSYSLVLHRRIHTSERNYVCEYCDKTFRASSYLQSHMKVHTGERPYKCLICEKAFSISGNLKRHLRIHDAAVEDDESNLKQTEDN